MRPVDLRPVLLRDVVLRPVVLRPVDLRPVVLRDVVLRDVVLRPVVFLPVALRPPVVFRPDDLRPEVVFLRVVFLCANPRTSNPLPGRDRRSISSVPATHAQTHFQRLIRPYLLQAIKHCLNFLNLDRGYGNSDVCIKKQRANDALVLFAIFVSRVRRCHPRYRTALCCSARTRDTDRAPRIGSTPREQLSTNPRVLERRSRDPLRRSAPSPASQLAATALWLFVASPGLTFSLTARRKRANHILVILRMKFKPSRPLTRGFRTARSGAPHEMTSRR